MKELVVISDKGETGKTSIVASFAAPARYAAASTKEPLILKFEGAHEAKMTELAQWVKKLMRLFHFRCC